MVHQPVAQIIDIVVPEMQHSVVPQDKSKHPDKIQSKQDCSTKNNLPELLLRNILINDFFEELRQQDLDGDHHNHHNQGNENIFLIRASRADVAPEKFFLFAGIFLFHRFQFKLTATNYIF